MTDYYGPAHWEKLYREGRMPWDAGGVPSDLDAWVGRGGGAGRALVPGCGSGYEAAALAQAGYETLAIDFSEAAVERARAVTAGSGARVEQADFFALDARAWDLIYERAFLCALPPDRREDWARQCARLLLPGGLLAGLFYLGETSDDGPPFPIPRPELDGLLGAAFEPLEDRASTASLPVFGDAERWQLWRRRAA